MAWKGNVLSLRIRILMSFIVCGFANILIPVLGAYLGSTSVSLGFVVLLIFFAGTGTSVVQSSLFGFASSFPSLYTQALMGGNGIAGFVVTLMRVFSKLIYKDDENVTMKSANLFFGIAAGFSMLCFLLFLVMERIPFARRFLDKLKHKKVDRLPALEESEDSSMLAYSEDENVISDSESIVEQEEPEYYKVSPLQVLKKVWKNGLVVCSVFTLTFMIFPGITSKLQSSTSFVSSEWYTLILFVQFNFFDLIGRTLPSYKILFTPKTLWIVSLGRFAFYPLFVLNLKGIFFVHDAWSLTFMALFALTNGYVASLAMIYGPSFVENDQDKETAGVIMAFFLNFGIFLGSHIALIMKLLGIGN
jgi:equilibrative nucleoside transporter 1/2/3